MSTNNGLPQPEQAFLFPPIHHHVLAVNFNGGHVSSDGGGVLLAQLDRSHGYLHRLATCFQDYRDPDLIEHTVKEMLRQRI